MVISMERWVGKTAIVTGASSGIGAALAERLVNEGLQVVALARRKHRLLELASKLKGKKGNFHPIVADVGKEADVLAAFKYIKENLGPVHIVVNNAGITRPGLLSKGKTDDWQEVLNVNVIGLCTVTREAIQDMQTNNVSGHIILINSMLGHYVLNVPTNVYTASKHAVTALTEMYRRELVSLKLKIKITTDKMVLSMDRWVGKTAIVTGASSGIGAALAERLVDEGLNVVGLARRNDLLDQLGSKLARRKGQFHPIVADVSNEDDILSAFKYIRDHLGPVHVVINNAGVGKPSLLSEGNTEDWRKMLEVNVLGLSVVTREAVRDMKGNNVNGHIIHINSVLGHYINSFPSNMYTASKHAVTALTEILRRELVSLNLKIKVTSISPGITDTDILADIRNHEKFKRIIEEKIILDTEDIVDGAIYVLSTPPHVQVHELMLRPVGEFLGN